MRNIIASPVACRRVLQRYKDLQDIIAILGMDELVADDKLIVFRARKIQRFLFPALPRGGSLHRHARRNTFPPPKPSAASKKSSTASTTTCPKRIST